MFMLLVYCEGYWSLPNIFYKKTTNQTPKYRSYIEAVLRVTKGKTWKDRNLQSAYLLPGFEIQGKEENIKSALMFLISNCIFH